MTMYPTAGHIFFSAGNPWPEGHAIERAQLFGRLRHNSLDILLSVATCPYDASPDLTATHVCIDRNLDPTSGVQAPRNTAWASREVWRNARQFQLSGLLLSSDEYKPLNILGIYGREFVFDELPEGRSKVLDDQSEFVAYCLSHDAVASVRVRFDDTAPADGFVWANLSGRLMVPGDDDFYRGFYGRARIGSLTTITVAERYSDTRAKRLLKELLVQADQFTLSRDKQGGKRFIMAQAGEI